MFWITFPTLFPEPLFSSKSSGPLTEIRLHPPKEQTLWDAPPNQSHQDPLPPLPFRASWFNDCQALPAAQVRKTSVPQAVPAQWQVNASLIPNMKPQDADDIPGLQ